MKKIIILLLVLLFSCNLSHIIYIPETTLIIQCSECDQIIAEYTSEIQETKYVICLGCE